MLTERVLQEADVRLAAVYGRYSEVLARRPPVDPLDRLIHYLVNQRTTHAAAARALAAVREHYPTWAAVAAAPHDHLAGLLRPTGLADARAARVQGVLRQVCLDMGDYTLAALREWPTEQVMRYLRGLPGVGPHAAALLAMFVLRRRGVFPVESVIHRVAGRLGWVTPGVTFGAVQRAVEGVGRNLDLTDLHVNLIELGRQHCRADGTACWECPLAETCPSSRVA